MREAERSAVDVHQVRGRLTDAARVMAVTLLLCAACSTAQNVPASLTERFVYDGRTYELDGYAALFDASTSLGSARQRLFAAYLMTSPEGQARSQAAGSTDPAVVWSRLAVEEKSTFVAITAALSCVEVDGGSSRFLDWLASLDEIHGDARFGGGTLSNSEAFRLYARLTQAGLALLRQQAGTFRNTCNNEVYAYGGLGSTHVDYCATSKLFDSDAKFDDSPGVQGIQFNFNDSRSDCADIDIDYSVFCHLTRGNSNVLDNCGTGKHITRFVSEYGDGSGLRLVRTAE